jgi:hypothetical protein
LRKAFSEYLPYSLKIKVQRIRYWLRVILKVKPLLAKQLSTSHENDINFNKDLVGFKVIVPLIESKHYQYLHILAIAKALQIRGAEVKILLCGESLSGCEIKSVKNKSDNEPCYECKFNRKNIISLFSLDIITLNSLLGAEKIQQLMDEAVILGQKQLPEVFKNGILLNQSIEDSIVRYYYGNVPNESEELLSVRIAHTQTALIAAEVSKLLDESFSPNLVLNNMYCYSAWEPFFRYYRDNGNRFRSISISQFNFKSIVIDSFKLFQDSKRYINYIAMRSNKHLLNEEKVHLYSFLNNRFSGQSQIFKDWGCFDELVSDSITDELKKKLNYDVSKRNIFLFSNIYWDIGMSDCAALYPNIIDWVIDTIDLLKEDITCNLYIKPHPGEVFDSATSLKGVSQVIKDKYPILPKNVIIIEPHEKINTYSLFPLIDIGVIFNGTLGLEMMLNKIPVISAGKTTFQGLGFANEPNTRESYKNALLGKKKHSLPTHSELELYAYFYFVKTLIPWTLTKQAYADEFNGFDFASISDLNFGKDKYLDHIINCIVFPETTCFENWD